MEAQLSREHARRPMRDVKPPAVEGLDRGAILEGLQRAYSKAAMADETVIVYARFLADLDLAELERVVRRHVATSHRLPAISELRAAVFEERLALPTPAEAWELASRYAYGPREMQPCDAFGCNDGWVSIAEDRPCLVCRGTGEITAVRVIEPVVRRALDAVGGDVAVRDADRPEVVRAQFLRAYEAFRARELEYANLRSLDPALAPNRPAELPVRVDRYSASTEREAS